MQMCCACGGDESGADPSTAAEGESPDAAAGLGGAIGNTSYSNMLAADD